MLIQILCVGKLKEDYWKAALAEYSKRLSRFTKLEITELAEVRLPDGAGPAEEKEVIRKESEAIMAKMDRSSSSYNIALAIKGKELSSEGLAEKLSELQLSGKSKITFIIGGSLGLSDELLSSVDYKLSFSPMTFPHQMMRVILAEQVYRAFKINANEAYHK